jgi:hypothetical protein
MGRPIALFSVSALLHHVLFSADFITITAESSFRHPQDDELLRYFPLAFQQGYATP